MLRRSCVAEDSWVSLSVPFTKVALASRPQAELTAVEVLPGVIFTIKGELLKTLSNLSVLGVRLPSTKATFVILKLSCGFHVTSTAVST